MAKEKPFVCLECSKKLTFGEAKAASFRGCPKCGGSDIEVNPAALHDVEVEALVG